VKKKPLGTTGEMRVEGFFRGCVLLLLALVVLAVPTLFTRYTTEASRVKLFAMHLAVAAMLALMAIQAAWTGRLRFAKHGLHVAVGVWVLVNALSAVTSPFPYSSLNEFWRVAMLAGLYAATVYAVRSVQSLRLVAWLSVLATILVVGYGIIQIAGRDPVPYGQDPQNRVFSFLGNPNMLAAFLILMFWVVAGLALDSRRWSVRIALALLLIAVFVCLIMTKTKGAWIAMAASCVAGAVWFAVGWRFPYALERKRRLAVLGVIAVVAVFGLPFAYRPIAGRLDTFKSSAGVRMVYWRGALGVFGDHPLLGAGTGTFQVVYPAKRQTDFRASSAGPNTLHAHCEPLEILADLGVVGLLVWLWVLLAFYRGTLRTLSPEGESPARGLAAGMAMGVSALLLHNLVDVNMRWPTMATYLWVFLALSTIAPHPGKPSPSAEAELRLPSSGAARWGMVAIFLIVLGPMVKARVIDSWKSEVHYREGCLRAERERWDAALKRYTRAVELDPSNLRARYGQANCYLWTNQYAEGIRAYLCLEQLAPEYCKLHNFVGIMYAATGQWEEAAERLVKAQKSGTMPEDFSAAVRIAAIGADSGQGEKCLVGLRKVAELLPGDPMAHVCLGNYYASRDQTTKATAEFERALDIDEACMAALRGLADTCFFAKEYSRTIDLCERILAIAPQLHEIRVNLGLAYLFNGQRAKAVAEWRRVLRENPNDSRARASLKDLGLSEEP